MPPQAKVAVIGGSGFYQIEGIQNTSEVAITTPFGDPSDAIIVGELEGVPVAFLPRHGRGHRIMPTELPQRANIYALKTLGVEWIIAVSAVGSMQEQIRPLDIVIPDQLFDRTTKRVSTFFGNGIVAHVGMADPFSPALRTVLIEAAGQAAALPDASDHRPQVHNGGTYICIEGPQFSTRAESRIYRQWGVDVIGMTASPEAKLAREAEIAYAVMALSTDYDVWHQSADDVTVEMVINNLNRNVSLAKQIVKLAVPCLATMQNDQAHALQYAIMTNPALIPPQVKEELAPIIGKYIK